MYPEQGTIAQMYHDQDTFDFSQGYICDQELINDSRCLVEWKSRNMTQLHLTMSLFCCKILRTKQKGKHC